MSTPVVVALGLAVLSGAPRAQGSDSSSLVEPEVRSVLDAAVLDQQRFLALVHAGAAAVPGLLRAVGDGNDVTPAGLRRQGRALRCLRLIGPSIADAAVPTLLAAVARDISRDDVGLLVTLAELAPGLSNKPQMIAAVRAIRIAHPEPVRDMTAFGRWVAKMRLWYDFQLRMTWSPPGDVKALQELLGDEDPLRRRAAAQRLGAIGHRAASAIPDLAVVASTKEHPRVTQLAGVGSLTADFHDLVRDAAAIAIARIDSTHPAARRGLTLLLRADAPQERFAVLMAMTPARGADDVDAVAAVLEATGDDDERVAAEAITTLVRLQDPRPEVLQRLRALAGSPSGALATRAAAALRSLER